MFFVLNVPVYWPRIPLKLPGDSASRLLWGVCVTVLRIILFFMILTALRSSGQVLSRRPLCWDIFNSFIDTWTIEHAVDLIITAMHFPSFSAPEETRTLSSHSTPAVNAQHPHRPHTEQPLVYSVSVALLTEHFMWMKSHKAQRILWLAYFA